MSALSNEYENKLLDHSLGTAALTAPSTVYVALFTSDPSTGATSENLEANIVTDEVSSSGTSYARQAATFTAAASGSASNDANITFPTATANWGTITHVAVMDDYSSAGDDGVIYYGALDTAKIIETGDTFQITTGNLTITLA